MVTFKQLEALYWIAQLGSFEAAATKLNMSQSAMSKRISELEEAFDVPMFDRVRRTAQLTPKGSLLLAHATELLARRDEMLMEVSDKSALVGRYRIGVTELTALTWLPSWIEKVNILYPRLKIEPSVDVGSSLFHQLEHDKIDLIVVSALFNDVRFNSRVLDNVENSWMCSPRILPFDNEATIEKMAHQTLITQETSSGTGLLYQRWLAENEIKFQNSIKVNNILAQIGLAMSGLGVACLPRHCLAHLVENGSLREIKITQPLPSSTYIALHRADRWAGVSSDIAALAQRHCDFSKLLVR